MYRTGHYGAALVLYAPLGAALLVADLTALAVVGGGLSLALSSLPDVDTRLPFLAHRGPTHSVAFALAVGTTLGAAGALAGIDASLERAALFGVVACLVGVTAVVSHLLADVLTPMGIRPWWPLSERHYTFAVTRADNSVANYALLSVGVLLCVGALTVAR